MKVLVWPAGGENDGTSQYRLYLPARVLAEQGADVTCTQNGPVVLWDQQWDPSLPHPPAHVRALALAQRPDADVVVMQRPALRWWADIIPSLQALGIRVVVDVDDRFDQLHKSHVGHGAYRNDYDTAHSHEWVSLACKRADLVTTTTPSLAARYGFGHARVLPNLVPERYLSIDSDPIPKTIGWSGTVETHPVDLQATGGAVGRVLSAEPSWSFYAVGTGHGVREALSLSREPLTSGGWVPFDEYPQSLSEAAIGIVPLAESAFNDGKSCLKMMEYAAVGVPVIGSPTPDNLRLNALGVGAIAASPNQWAKRLKSLINNEDYRETMAGRGREVMAGLTYERHAERWWNAWTGGGRSEDSPALTKVTAG